MPVCLHAHRHTELFSHQKSSVAICSNTDGPREHYTKLSQKRQILQDISYMWNRDNNTNESIYRAGTDSQTQKTNLRLPQWKVLGRRINEGYGINSNALLYIKQISNKDLLQNIGNNTQYLVTRWKIISKHIYVTYIYIYEIHFTVHLELTEYCKPAVLK